MSHRRSGIRNVAIMMAGLMAATAVGPAGGSGVIAADPAPSGPDASAVAPLLPTVTFGLPADADRSRDAALTVTEDPDPIAGPLDLGAAVDAGFDTAAGLPGEEWDLETIADSLGDDPAAAFRFVRDRIRFEPYPGVLRGAAGTLAARAGNALDRAVLLQDLLTRMGSTSRFALATLDPATASTLAEHTFDPATQPLSPAGAAALTSFDGTALSTRARRDYARLRDALGDALDGTSMEPWDAVVADVQAHAWVQVSQGGGWLDLDPSLPDSEPGQTLADAATTPDSMPDEARQTVTLQMVAETLVDGYITPTVVLERSFTAEEAASSDILVSAAPGAASGGGLLGGVGAPTAAVPEMVVNGTAQAGDPFPIGDGDDGGGFGLGGGGEPAFLGLDLMVIRGVPGQDDRVTSIRLVDRVPAEARASGSMSIDQALPIQAGALDRVHHVMISSGSADPRNAALERGLAASFVGQELTQPDAARRYSRADVLWPLMVTNEELVLSSERVIVPAIGQEGAIESIVARPRVFLVSLGADPADPDHIRFTTDLAIDGIRLVARPGTDPAAVSARQVWYGVLESALEAEFIRDTTAALDPSSRNVLGTSQAMDQPLTVLTSADAGSLPASAAPALADALGIGLITVVPGDPATAPAWWTVSPDTGATRAVLAPGLGGGLAQGGWTAGGGSYTNATSSNVVYEIDANLNTIVHRGGQTTRPARLPPRAGGCGGGEEYVSVVGCVGIGTIFLVGAAATVITLLCVISIYRTLRGR